MLLVLYIDVVADNHVDVICWYLSMILMLVDVIAGLSVDLVAVANLLE